MNTKQIVLKFKKIKNFIYYCLLIIIVSNFFTKCSKSESTPAATSSSVTWLSTQTTPLTTQDDINALDGNMAIFNTYFGKAKDRWTAANMKPVFDLLKKQWDYIPGTGSFKEYKTAYATSYNNKSIFSTKPIFKTGGYQEGEVLGANSIEVLTHWRKWFNFLRSIANLPPVIHSNFKQAASMAQNYSGAKGLGGHYPTLADATAKNFPLPLYYLVYLGGSTSALSGASVWNTNYPSEVSTYDDGDFNSSLTSIWAEGEGNSIKGILHRYMFLGSEASVGISTVPKYRTYTVWLTKAGDTTNITKYNNIDGLNKAKIDASDPLMPSYTKKFDDFVNSNYATVYPGELVPWVSLGRTYHQSFSIDFKKAKYTLNTTAATTMSVELWSGSTIAGLTKTQTKSYSAAPTADQKGTYNKYKLNNVDTDNDFTLDNAQAANVTGGDYLETRYSGASVQFRVPFEWFYEIYNEFKNSATPKYYQIRATFNIPSTDVRQGAGATTSEFRWTIFDLEKHTTLN